MACIALKLLLPSLAFRPKEPNADSGALAGGRIDQVHGVLVEQVMAFAAHVAHLGDETACPTSCWTMKS